MAADKSFSARAHQAKGLLDQAMAHRDSRKGRTSSSSSQAARPGRSQAGIGDVIRTARRLFKR